MPPPEYLPDQGLSASPEPVDQPGTLPPTIPATILNPTAELLRTVSSMNQSAHNPACAQVMNAICAGNQVLQGENSRLVHEIVHLKNNNDAKDKALVRLQSDVDRLTERLATVEATRDLYRDKLSSLAASHPSIQGFLQSLDDGPSVEDAGDNKFRIVGADDRTWSGLERLVQTSRIEISDVEQELATANTFNARLRRQIMDLNLEMAQVMKRAKTIAGKHQEVASEYERAKRNNTLMLKGREARIARLEKEADLAKMLIALLRNALDRAHGRIPPETTIEKIPGWRHPSGRDTLVMSVGERDEFGNAVLPGGGAGGARSQQQQGGGAGPRPSPLLLRHRGSIVDEDEERSMPDDDDGDATESEDGFAAANNVGARAAAAASAQQGAGYASDDELYAPPTAPPPGHRRQQVRFAAEREVLGGGERQQQQQQQQQQRGFGTHTRFY